MNYLIANKLNLSLVFLLLVANGTVLFGLPTLFHYSNFLGVSLLLLTLITTNTYWGLIHEGIHYSLNHSKKVNDYLSRLLSVIFGCSFSLLRMSHLVHHRFNRSEHDRYEVFESDKHSWWSKTFYYYWFLVNGLYFVELILPCLCFLPRSHLEKILNNIRTEKTNSDVINHLKKQIQKPNFLQEIRVDTICIYFLYIISFILYGRFFWILLLILLLRGFLISAADNLPHYATPIDDRKYAFNLAAPRWLGSILLNFNYHRIHHHSPNIPWHLLPQAFIAKGERMDTSYMKQWLRQFKGLIPIENIPRIGKFK